MQTYKTEETKNKRQSKQIETTHLRGLAKTRCPKVTKLVSWLDMNHANEETLHEHIQQIRLKEHKYREKPKPQNN